MTYLTRVIPARFLARPNRFIAVVEVDEAKHRISLTMKGVKEQA